MKLRKIILTILCCLCTFIGSVCNAKVEPVELTQVVSKDAFITGQVIFDLNPRLDENYLFDLADSIVILSEQYNIPKEVIIAIIAQESNFNPAAYNRSGATGLGQIIPSWWSVKFNFDKKDLWDWRLNLSVAVRILDELKTNYGQQHDWMAFYYTAAPGPRSHYYASIKKRMSHISYLLEKYENDFEGTNENDG